MNGHKVNTSSLMLELRDQFLIIWSDDTDKHFFLHQLDLDYIEEDVFDNNALSGEFDCLHYDISGEPVMLYDGDQNTISVKYLVISKNF